MSSNISNMMIFLSYVKMHFFYVKSNILRKWSNDLRKFYVTMFNPGHSGGDVHYRDLLSKLAMA